MAEGVARFHCAVPCCAVPSQHKCLCPRDCMLLLCPAVPCRAMLCHVVPSQGAACMTEGAASSGPAVPRGRVGRLPLVWGGTQHPQPCPALPCPALPREGEVLAQPVPIPSVPAAVQRGHASPGHVGHGSHCPGKLERGSWLSAARGARMTCGPQCNLQGLWRNELGSNMTLSALDTAGTFSGSYHTAVAATNKQILVSPLQGAQQHPGAKGQPTFGFTVQWQFAGTAVPATASRGSQRSPAHAGRGVPPGWSPGPPVAPREALAVATDQPHALAPAMGRGGGTAVCLGRVAGASLCLGEVAGVAVCPLGHGRGGA